MRWWLIGWALLGCSRPPAPTRAPAPAPAPTPVAAPAPVEPRFEARCERNELEACLAGARRARAGFAVMRDVDLAVKLYQRACDAGRGDACLELALLYLDIDQRSQSYVHDDERIATAERAFELEPARCRFGVAAACVNGINFPDTSAAVKAELYAVLEQRCAAGEVQHCTAIATFLDSGMGPVARDQHRAGELFISSCTLGDGAACPEAARAIQYGHVGPSDDAQIHELATLGCARGDAESCFRLAEEHRDRQPRPAELRAATLGCSLGDAEFCRHAKELGDRQHHTAKAQALYRKACEAGSESGCGWLVRYLDGDHGGTKDLALARVFKERACARGGLWDCIELAKTVSAAGEVERARRLFAIACDEGEIVDACVPELALYTPTERDARLAAMPRERRDIARYLCCHDPAAPPANPTEALLALRDAIRSNDTAAVAALVHPKRGLRARLASSGEDFTNEEIVTLRGKQPIELEPLARAMSFNTNRMSCAEVEQGVAACRVFEGGFQADYTVLVEKSRMYVLELDERSH